MTDTVTEIPKPNCHLTRYHNDPDYSDKFF